jgi:hypothetical protein
MGWIWIVAALAADSAATESSAPVRFVVDEKAAAACLLMPRGIAAGKATLRGVPLEVLPPARLWDLAVPAEREAYFRLCPTVVGSACVPAELVSLDAASCLIGASHFVGLTTPPPVGGPMLVGAPDGSLRWTQDYREPGACRTPADIQVDARSGAVAGDPPLHPVCE